ncbi:N-acetylmuramoyl-L-alanine amidase [Leptolyngbya sp. NK1-12]|uniref:N-acetylmuramoyl-L-alanine amidase n=1 Tax=Leptolyngbya sp. NK1-12 TaxID=2547451 RepID=A0AA96WGP6_9CYAN|nr:N-acetylmuramoyl-L-alanine amidase [Leptolyngbya sp. NK1-12]WNZ25133.1 N-acetylmuramoyl-L-alanine amidase [Leptolyngbya sp. NK1-12]
MKLHWLVPSLIGAFCLTAPAQAGQLTTWQFHSNQNRLEFTTDEDVQPRAQLVFDPTRLVIDLPGMHLGQEPVNQPIGGAIQNIRIGQFDAQTTRIVVELAPGYTLDPQQIRFRGLSPTEWSVQLPQPQRIDAANPPVQFPSSAQPTTASSVSAATSFPSPSATAAGSTAPSRSQTAVSTTSRSTASRAGSTARSTSSTTRSTAGSSTDSSAESIAQIESVQVTSTGLLLRTAADEPAGDEPKVSIQRSRSRRTITIRLENARLSPRLRDRERQINRHGIDDLEIDQDADADTVVEIKLDVSRRSPDWQAEVSEGGILLRPVEAETATAKLSDPEPPVSLPSSVSTSTSTTVPTPNAPTTVAEQPSPARLTAPSDRSNRSNSVPRIQTATIQGVDLDVSGNQLLIQTDRPVAHQARWQGGMYIIELSPARLAGRVSGPQLTPADPLRRIRLRQDDEQKVVITIQPATGVQFGEINLITPQILALTMQRATARTTSNNSSRSLPNVVPQGRLVVVIDPGHGGVDVGAVGVGNLYEADVVLPIAQQVATLLQQQGIQAVLTRNSNVEIDLEPRVQMAEQAQANLFVSIHANSMGMERPDINGAETYYYASGEALAQTIQSSIVSSLGMNDRGVKQARFYVLRRTSMPSVLVETGFVTGSEDGPRLADANFRNQMAVAIARGILLYIQQQAMAGSR